MTNTGSISETDTLVADFDFATTSVSSTKAVVKLAPGQTATRTFTYKVSKSSARGTYSFVATESDVTGAVSSSATFTVT
jgi:helix-turn-helix protein